MNFLCEVHIPVKLAKFLQSKGHSAKHVNQLPAKWHTEASEICALADKMNALSLQKRRLPRLIPVKRTPPETNPYQPWEHFEQCINRALFRVPCIDRGSKHE